MLINLCLDLVNMIEMEILNNDLKKSEEYSLKLLKNILIDYITSQLECRKENNNVTK